MKTSHGKTSNKKTSHGVAQSTPRVAANARTHARTQARTHATSEHMSGSSAATPSDMSTEATQCYLFVVNNIGTGHEPCGKYVAVAELPPVLLEVERVHRQNKATGEMFNLDLLLSHFSESEFEDVRRDFIEAMRNSSIEKNPDSNVKILGHFTINHFGVKGED